VICQSYTRLCERTDLELPSFRMVNLDGVSEMRMLEVKKINVRYDFLQVLWDISIALQKGEFVCLIGPNGAGKSTILKTIAGLICPVSGDIFFNGHRIAELAADEIAKLGISFISEGLNLFTAMTVGENLAVGAFTVKDKVRKQKNADYVFELFPRLRERRAQLAGTLSGGERKMLAIGRGLMSNPTLLLVDEPSLGLAPQLAEAVLEALRGLNQTGLTILLVEQNAVETLRAVTRGYVVEKGKIVLEGKSSDLSQNDHIREVYLGV
jgi:ABC-type branched-subunit amino acid transport system ATPase component